MRNEKKYTKAERALLALILTISIAFVSLFYTSFTPVRTITSNKKRRMAAVNVTYVHR